MPRTSTEIKDKPVNDELRLTRFTVENYKAFARSTPLELRPITLLYGFNSVGKSALLRALPLLAASADKSLRSPLTTRGASARGAAFAELISRKAGGPFIEFELEWGNTNLRLVARFRVRDLPELRTQVIEELVLTEGDENQVAKFLWIPSTEVREGSDEYSCEFKGSSFKLPLSFAGLIPTLAELKDEQREVAELLDTLAEQLVRLNSSVHWLSALRAVPARYQTFVGEDREIGMDGERAGQALAYDQALGGTLLNMVSEWYERSTGNTLTVEEFALGSGTGFTLKLSDVNSPLNSINIVDTGEGMGQVLPVLVLVGLAATGRLGDVPILCIEHPELHLQPSAHGYLATFLAKSLETASDTTFIVETHSENLLLQMQLEIARGSLSPQDVIVHWLSRDKNGEPLIETINYDEAARPIARNWPREAFSVSTEIAKAIVEERRNKEVRVEPETIPHEG